MNLRTQFERIVKHAGLKKWPRLFHNLRSSRQTELAETFPSHVVCAWLGNSEDIAKKHYYQVTDAHFAAASGQSPAPATSAPVARLLDPAGTSANFDAPVAQISTQHDAAPESTEPQNVSEPFEPTGCYALSCISLPDDAETAKRMGWDSNPRATFAAAGFQDRCIQPLCHPSLDTVNDHEHGPEHRPRPKSNPANAVPPTPAAGLPAPPNAGLHGLPLTDHPRFSTVQSSNNTRSA